MKPLSRNPVDRRDSARSFNRNASHTKAINLRSYGFRGGIRL